MSDYAAHNYEQRIAALETRLTRLEAVLAAAKGYRDAFNDIRDEFTTIDARRALFAAIRAADQSSAVGEKDAAHTRGHPSDAKPEGT